MKILFIHKQILFPHDTGGKIRALNVLRHLARWHDVTYLCNLRPGEEGHVPEMATLGLRIETVMAQQSRPGSWRFYKDLALNLLSPYPFTIVRNYDPRLAARAHALVESRHYDLVICDCPQMALHAMDLKGPVKILFQHNVEAQIFQRHAALSGGRLRSHYMGLQWKKMRRFEAECGKRFDAVIAVSEQDRQTFQRDYAWGHVSAIDTAVDVDYFRLRGNAEQPDRVVFVGSMDWLPNQDGVQYFLRHVWPHIRRARPSATFQVVGRNPPLDVQRLGGVDGVEIVGTVPDVRPYLAEAAVVVVPLLVGGGTRLKIFEAMAMGKAVVSSSIGAEGLPVTAGEHLVLADSSSDFAEAVTRLLDEPRCRLELGKAAHSLVTRRYGSETVARQFEQICQHAVYRQPPAEQSQPSGQAVGLALKPHHCQDE
jgi:glycosyltransferase involved in cell wall biosynthesis